MFDPERLYRSWALTNAALQVLRANRQLMVFPIVSSILSLFVTVAFGMLAFRYSDSFGASSHYVLSAIPMFAYYVAEYFVAFFVNTALIGAALMALRGKQPTVADGIALATDRVGAILGYAVLATTVGTFLHLLKRRFGAFGRLVLNLYGLSWNIATYLVAPVLIAEKLDPVAAVQRSAELLQRTWGEQIVGNVSIRTVFAWIMFLVLLPILVLACYGGNTDSHHLLFAAFLLLVLAVSVLAVLQSTLTGIYTAAVYLYAADDIIVEQFDAELVRNAFRPK